MRLVTIPTGPEPIHGGLEAWELGIEALHASNEESNPENTGAAVFLIYLRRR